MPTDAADTAPSNGPRLALVVEDLHDTRAWLVQALERAFSGIRVVAVPTLAQAREFLKRSDAATLAELRLALVDLGLPDGSGVDLIAELADRHPQVMPIVATVYDDDAHLYDAIAAGAQGYLLKNQDADVLVKYLHRIDSGEPPLSPSIARRMMMHFRGRAAAVTRPVPEAASLTPREVEVLALLGKGGRVPEVAYRLGLTEQTVATYVKAIYKKLRISSRAEAAIEAARRGLL